MTVLEQIRALASQGVSRANVEAMIGRAMTPAEVAAWRRAQTVRRLKAAQDREESARRRAQAAQREPMSGAERKRRHLEREAAIDDQLDAALDAIDWHRRRLATRSLICFMRAYCMEPISKLLDDTPDGALVKICHDMQRGISDATIPFHIRMPRGEGKTAFTKAACAWAAATGMRHHIMVFAAARPDAVQIVDDVLAVFLGSDAFAVDFPEVAIPLRAVNGSFKRRQFYNGRATAMQCRTGKLTLPTIIAKRDIPALGVTAGAPFPASGAIFDARGFQGHARGAAKGASRPDLLILDDLQDEAEAANEETVAKNAERIRKGILNMGGRKRVAAIMTSTPIEPGDLSETFAADPAWRTRTYRAFRAFPDDWKNRGMDGLWGSYIGIYRRGVAHGDPNPARAATEFYRMNQAAMDAGAEVISRRRFDPRTQISGIQAKMDKMFEIGGPAFEAEYQMKPRRHQFVFELTAQMVLERIRKGFNPTGPNASEMPFGFDYIAAATDINPSYALTTAVIAFDRDRTGIVLWHWIDRISIPDIANDTYFHDALIAALAQHGRVLAASGLKLNAWGIDAGGKQFPITTEFVQLEAAQVCGVRPIALWGRNSLQYNPYVSSRRRDAINDTVDCSRKATDQYGRTKEVNFWTAFNADLFRESSQRAWATETGGRGGLSLFDGGISHEEFAEQVAREKLKAKRSKPDGKMAYEWKTADPHDFGDCVTMCYALAARDGIAAGGKAQPVPMKRKRRVIIR